MDKKTLYKFFDEKASSQEKEAIKEWLEASPANKEQLLKERAFYDAMIVSNYRPDVTVQTSKAPLRLTIIKEVVKVAAIIIIVLTFGFYYHQEKLKEASTAVNTIYVPAGQRANLILPDGTNVWLSARTEIKYPAIFTGSKREIQLNGEAYFDVNKQPDNPFIVHTKQGDIEVLGTQFYVEAYNDSEYFSTALISGCIKVNSKNNTVTLKPNQKADIRNGVLAVSPIVDYDPYRWCDGLICFKNICFTDLMKKFEKYYGIDIVIENKKVSDHIFSGKFRISDGIDNALRVLQKEAKYTFIRNSDDSVIYIQ